MLYMQGQLSIAGRRLPLRCSLLLMVLGCSFPSLITLSLLFLQVSEISRILKPGGVFVASTFLAQKAPFGDDLVKPLRQSLALSTPQRMKYWEPDELEELCRVCGLVEYTSYKNRNFIMLSAVKPS